MQVIYSERIAQNILPVRCCRRNILKSLLSCFV